MPEHRLFAETARALMRKSAALMATTMLVLAPVVEADRTKLKPGWNLFSPAQDVEIGKGAAAEADKQLVMLNDARVDRYVDALGKRLAAKAPGEKYPYQFKVVNDKSINAFALPGGYIYVHRGVIEAADNEAQLAGVIGHEIGHVALRHGTNQASKATLTQGLLALGGSMAGGGLGGAVAQLGGTFVANGVLLKYSRDAERQADLIGTQILYDSNYDPRAMAQFFEKLEGHGGSNGRVAEFFSSHPNPGNRMHAVQAESEKIGPFPKNPKTDTPDFRSIKAYVQGLPNPPKAGTAKSASGGAATPGNPSVPSSRLRAFENRSLRLQYPDNWQAQEQGDAVAFIPDGGAVKDAQGNGALAYGVMINMFEPHADHAGKFTHEEANDQLIEELRRGNPKMRVYRLHETIRVGPERVTALSTTLVNESPVGGRELDWLVTVVRPEGLMYFIFVVPEKDADTYNRSFQSMLDSVRFGATAR